MSVLKSLDWSCEIVLRKDTLQDSNSVTILTDPEFTACGLSLKFRLDQMLVQHQSKISDEFINRFRTPIRRSNYDSVESRAKHLLTETVRGQEFLELMISNYTNWGVDSILNIDPPRRNGQKDVVFVEDMDLNERFENGSVERWKPDSEYEMKNYVEENQQDISDILGIPIEARYVIRLVDENLNHWVYVGESTNLPNRLMSHIQQDGDFREARRTNMSFLRVEEIREDVDESELYEEACCEYGVPEDRVCGEF